MAPARRHYEVGGGWKGLDLSGQNRPHGSESNTRGLAKALGLGTAGVMGLVGAGEFIVGYHTVALGSELFAMGALSLPFERVSRNKWAVALATGSFAVGSWLGIVKPVMNLHHESPKTEQVTTPTTTTTPKTTEATVLFLPDVVNQPPLFPTPCHDVPPHTVQPGESISSILADKVHGEGYTPAQLAAIFKADSSLKIDAIKQDQVIDFNCP